MMLQVVSTEVVFEDPGSLQRAIGVTEGLQLIAKHDPDAAEASAEICRERWNGNMLASNKRIGYFTPFSRYGNTLFGLIYVDEILSKPDEYANLRALLPDPSAKFYDCIEYPAYIGLHQPKGVVDILMDTFLEEGEESHLADHELVTEVSQAIRGSLRVDPAAMYMKAIRRMHIERLRVPPARRFPTAAAAFTSAKNRSPRD